MKTWAAATGDAGVVARSCGVNVVVLLDVWTAVVAVRSMDFVLVAVGRDDAMFLASMRELGKLLVIFGGVIVFLGLALWSGFGAGWLGRLPGDVRIERGHSTFYFPIVTCIIISIVLSLILSLFRR